MVVMRGLDPRIHFPSTERNAAVLRAAMPGQDALGRIKTLSAESCDEKAERRRTAAQRAGR
jgi:hypothetical protein